MDTGDTVKTWLELEGKVVRLSLASPPRNILDQALVSSLRAAARQVPAGALAAILDHEGPHFSYGSSIEEHLPGKIERALPAFHDLFRELVAFPVPLVGCVRGRCLGGGLELAASCDVVFASPDATFGVPEVRLGVFAPVASLVLRERVGEGHARDLLLSGRTVAAPEALRVGLVQAVVDEPVLSALTWVREHVIGLSPSSTRHATRAARMAFAQRFLPALDAMEAVYLGELMATQDAEEGVRAFLEGRPPRWREA